MFNTDLFVNVPQGRTPGRFYMISSHLIDRVLRSGYSFEGYGRYRNIALSNQPGTTDDNPGFDFYDPDKPIFTHPRFAVLAWSAALKSTHRRGCIEHATVNTHHWRGSQIGDGSIVRDTIMMGADYYGV